MNHEILENKLERFFSGCKFIIFKKIRGHMPRVSNARRIRGGLYLLATLSVFFMTAAQLCSQETYSLFPGKTSLAERREASFYIQSADTMISKLIGSGTLRKQQGKLQIFLLGSDDRNKLELYVKPPAGLFLNLPVSSDWQNDEAALKPLLRGMICIRCGITPSKANLAKIPDWLLSGLAYRLKTQQTVNDSLTPYILQPHPNVTFLAAEGKIPSLELLLDTPTSQKDIAAYTAYVELCDLLIEICNKKSPLKNRNLIDVLVNLSVNSSAESKASEIFNKLKDTPQESIKLKEFNPSIWFADGAAAYTMNHISPSALGFLLSRFRENMEIDLIVLNKDNKQEEIHCRLEQLAENLEQLENKTQTMQTIVSRFQTMANESPVIIREPLFRIASHTVTLTAEKAPLFAQSIKDAEKDFYAALDKHIAIEAYLKTQEIAFIPPGVRHDSYMRTLAELDDAEYKRMNDINNYLDIMESKRKDSK